MKPLSARLSEAMRTIDQLRAENAGLRVQNATLLAYNEALVAQTNRKIVEELDAWGSKPEPQREAA